MFTPNKENKDKKGYVSDLARACIPFLLLLIVLIALYFIFIHIGAIAFFWGFLKKGAGLVAVEKISCIFTKNGFSGGASAMLIRCAVRALVTAGIGANMMLPEGTSGASSSELTLEQAVLYEKEAIRASLINGISRYLDLFEKDIIQEYPEAAVKIGTLPFLEDLRKSLVSDYGFENPSPSSLTDLKTFHSVIKKELSFLEDKSPYWKNNIIYDNLRGVILREKG